MMMTCITKKNLSSPVDMHTHAGSASDNLVILTFNLLTSGSMHAEQLPHAVCLLSLVLIAQIVFVLEHGHSDLPSLTEVGLHQPYLI